MTETQRDRVIDLFLKFKYHESAEGQDWSPGEYMQAKLEFDSYTANLDRAEVGRVIIEYLEKK